MKIINAADANAAGALAEWARDAYIAACHQSGAKQWTAEAAGYPDGHIECYDIHYGSSTSEDIYCDRAYSLLIVRGEVYDYVETEVNYDDDPQLYQEEIDGYIVDDAIELYGSGSEWYDNDNDDIARALANYREWIADKAN